MYALSVRCLPGYTAAAPVWTFIQLLSMYMQRYPILWRCHRAGSVLYGRLELYVWLLPATRVGDK
jgi:hypothetical protein